MVLEHPTDRPSAQVNVMVNDIEPDGDALTVTAVTQGGEGTVTILTGGGGVIYQLTVFPAHADSFTYTVSDGRGGSSTATVNVTFEVNGD